MQTLNSERLPSKLKKNRHDQERSRGSSCRRSAVSTFRMQLKKKVDKTIKIVSNFIICSNFFPKLDFFFWHSKIKNFVLGSDKVDECDSKKAALDKEYAQKFKDAAAAIKAGQKHKTCEEISTAHGLAFEKIIESPECDTQRAATAKALTMKEPKKPVRSWRNNSFLFQRRRLIVFEQIIMFQCSNLRP